MLETTDYDLALHTCQFYTDQGIPCTVTFSVGVDALLGLTRYRVIDLRTQEALKLLED